MQIRTRLTFQFAGIVAFLLLIFSITIYSFTSLYRKSDFYDRILHRAQVTAIMFLEADEVTQAQAQENLKLYYQVLPHEIVQIYDTHNNLVFHEGEGSLEVPDDFLNKVRQATHQEYERDNRQVVGMRYADNQGDYVIVASSIDEYSLRKLANLKILLILGYIGSLGVVWVAGWFFAKQAMRPIQRVVQEVEKITASDLHLRLSHANGKDEVAHLAQTFNHMLERLETAFDMQRTFISNASHELRTPLTAMIGEMEVALMRERSSAEYEQVIHSTLEDARQLAALSNGLLQMVQASFDASKISMRRLRIDELLWDVIGEVQRRRPGNKVELDAERMARDENLLTVEGSEPLLQIALVNVMENAAKFSQQAEPVRVILETGQGKVTIRVIDRGRGIGPLDLKHVFVPFFRAVNVRDISGHGIGLPLAEKIVNIHGGSISVLSEIGKGTEVVIRLPNLS